MYFVFDFAWKSGNVNIYKYIYIHIHITYIALDIVPSWADKLLPTAYAYAYLHLHMPMPWAGPMPPSHVRGPCHPPMCEAR